MVFILVFFFVIHSSEDEGSEGEELAAPPGPKSVKDSLLAWTGGANHWKQGELELGASAEETSNNIKINKKI